MGHDGKNFWKKNEPVRIVAHQRKLSPAPARPVLQPDIQDLRVNVLNIVGSPRKNGTSARIAAAFTETAATYGAAISEYTLNTMNYRGCQACEGCHTRAEHCVLRDDATPVLAALHTTDIVVLSAPIYFGDTCGQFKTFFDRLWSLIRTDTEDEASCSRLPPGKTAILILTHVEPAEASAEMVDRYVRNLELMGFLVRPILASGLRLSSQADVDAQIRTASGLARELARAD